MSFSLDEHIPEKYKNELVERPIHCNAWMRYDHNWFYGSCTLKSDDKEYFFTETEEIEIKISGPYRTDYFYKNERYSEIYNDSIMIIIHSLWDYPEGWDSKKLLTTKIENPNRLHLKHQSLAYWFAVNDCPIEVPLIFKGYYIFLKEPYQHTIYEGKISELLEEYKNIVPKLVE